MIDQTESSRRARNEAVERLAIRDYGLCQAPEKEGKMMHSKTMITTISSMIGSCNSSRFRHGQDVLILYTLSRCLMDNTALPEREGQQDHYR